ncbi:efflux RND transporter periplasmic adaptor subunit [Halocynthiibacter namhaensis]|uniref:efflux RND transporter periplasmic adaptor subunit n=1 Tax=Halocynthiibacter namhaensis TaxID=1290553 RepID=UPI0012E02464|nr:efflux RND transporter periplasmic adaptor subunit [Halocynthiibacter namhaensis]
MIDGVIVALRLLNSAGAAPQILFGQLPEGQPLEALHALCTDKTGIRKIGDRLCVTLPETVGLEDTSKASWIVWLFDHVPPVTELPGIIEQLRTHSAGFSAPSNNNEASDEPLALNLALKQLNGATRRNASALLQVAVNVCVEAGLCENAIAAQTQGGKVVRLEVSDQNLAPITGEMKFLLQSRMTADPTSEVIDRQNFDEASLDASLVADMAKSDGLMLDLPCKDEDGFAFILLGPAKNCDAEIASLRDLLSVVLNRKKRSGLRAKIMRYGGIAAAVALVVWLLLPAPIRITATALSQPAHAYSVALPFEAFVEQIFVQVGDQVDEGDVIAQFRSPALEERREEMVLQTETEKIAAQAALSANDYGAYVLAEQRIATNERQVAHLEARIDRLEVKAPHSGRIIAAMGREIIGAFVPPGEAIATVQPRANFNLRLSVGRVDAAQLRPGQTGDVWFRGISGQVWPLVITAPAMQEVDPNTGEDRLIFMARVEGDTQDDLFVGLAGFANIETGQAMRVKVMGRYVTEYLRMKAWTWFDLRF